jgi:hypothetical protein
MNRYQTRLTMQVLGATALFATAATAVPPEVGPQIRVDTGGMAQANETSISGGDSNPLELVGGWNDYRSNIKSGFALTMDGGKTWTDFLLRPPAPYQSSVEGDPMTCFDPRTGALWAGAISFSGNGGIYVARKDAGSSTFEPSVMARVSGGADKGWMAAGPLPGDPDSTRVYIAYNEGLLWSDDLGDTWSGPRPLQTGLGFLPRIGPNGELYIAYWDWLSGDGVMLLRSFDGGQTFDPPIRMATRLDVWGIDGTRFPGTFRVPPLTYLAVDPIDGTLYCVYFDTTNIVFGSRNVDLYFCRSTDQGSTWTTPTIINDDSDPPGDSFFPWLEVDTNGRIHMVFYDTRNQPQNDSDPQAFIEAFYSYSDDMGDSWTEMLLTEEPFNSENTGSGGGFIGDYSGLALAGGKVYPLYLSNQEGSSDAFVNVITTLVGDLNFDCTVDLADIGILLASYETDDGGDIDGDGDTDLADLGALLANYNESCS